MTASAMAGDREKVLAAGMNDHIVKPLNIDQMFATLGKWVTPAHPLSAGENTEAPTSVPADSDLPRHPGLDLLAGLRVMQGDTALYRKMLSRFCKSQGDFPQQFSDALANNDYEGATRLAHTLKGTSGNIGAQLVQKAAETLESACRDKEAKGTLQKLQAEVTEALLPLLGALEQYSSEPDDRTMPLEVDQQQQQQLSRQLQILLQESDAEAIEISKQLARTLTNPAQQAAFKPVLKALANYDFDAAETAFTDLLSQLDA